MILGIDYGTKRVGVALSDTSETLAFPREVLQNTKSLVADIAGIVAKENANIIVIGHSTDTKGKDNPVMIAIQSFKEKLEKEINVPVVFEREWFSSQEATRFTGANSMIDASAAAIILQRFLDRKRGAQNR
ncbi:MAG: Holliday junction resolvase RuvX [Candidatus Campbellbacteria bacterium]|nr:Holliday junction resolvase RuvX [Candidatus Campbellbacteria bacterium]